MDLSKRVAIVTGSGRGIGRAIALKLASYGAAIIVNDIESAVWAKDVVSEIKSKNGQSTLVFADISVSDDVVKLVEHAMTTYGRIDILVNNAGIARDRLIIRMSEFEWDQVLNINLKGAFLCTKEVLKHMLKQRWGRIVNIASIIGLMGNAGQANYAAAKAGIIALTKTTAKEAASRGITANAVAPGFIDTEMTKGINGTVKETYVKQIPLGYLGQPEDVANAVSFLVSEDAGYITGQVLNVDGGMVMV